VEHSSRALTSDEHGTGMDFAAQQHAAMVNYKAEPSPFQSLTFQENVLESVQPLHWWKSQADYLKQETVSVVHHLLTATTSSAGVEPIFIIRFGTFRSPQSTWN